MLVRTSELQERRQYHIMGVVCSTTGQELMQISEHTSDQIVIEDTWYICCSFHTYGSKSNGKSATINGKRRTIHWTPHPFHSTGFRVQIKHNSNRRTTHMVLCRRRTHGHAASAD